VERRSSSSSKPYRCIPCKKKTTEDEKANELFVCAGARSSQPVPMCVWVPVLEIMKMIVTVRDTGMNEAMLLLAARKTKTIICGEMAQSSCFSVAWAKRVVGLAGLKTSDWIETKTKH
jgi:hypothetical protein